MKYCYLDMKGALTTAMVDRRLRQLDQIPEITYWRDDYAVPKAQTKAERQAAVFAKSRAKLEKMEKKENKPVPKLVSEVNLRVSIPTSQTIPTQLT
jgi:hypothetical protein